MAEFSRGKIEVLLDAMKSIEAPEVAEPSRITVHAAISRFSFLYERVRNAVDYKDEHLLRKSAIVRILKRHISMESDPSVIGLQLIRELIAARYLPNATLPESMAEEVGGVVRKYQALVGTRTMGEKHRAWLLGVVSAEIEEIVDSHRREKILTNFLYESLADRIKVENMDIDDTERRLQSYIACNRSLSRHDDEMLSYKLVRVHFPAWMQPESWIHDPKSIALQMVGIQAKIERELAHPHAQRFIKAVKPWSIGLLVLREALQEAKDKKALLERPDELKAVVDRIASRLLEESKDRLRRGTIRAMVYLFATKIVVALASEVPIEYWFYHEVHPISLAVNVFFPPILMFFVGRLIRMPGKDNNARVWECVEELLSPEGVSGATIRVPKPPVGAAKILFSVAYAITFLLTFGLIYGVLTLLSFTWISAIIFIFFLCLVSFFGYRLRLNARQYVVVAPRDQMRNVVLDFFFLPILRAGQWLSNTVSRLNIFVVILDFIIEAPYKIFLNILEDWFGFVKEKKEELQ